MKKNLAHLTHQFLEKYCDFTKPVLLALSGGPDSLALLDTLMKCKEKLRLDLHVAHVDHGWRKESTAEAEKLKDLINRLGLPWHFTKLKPIEKNINAEDACRKERLLFFRSLCQEHSCQAVLLGHHADDQAETVLKRVLEGATLTNLSALNEITHMPSLTLWRPFLPVRKKEILSWVKLRGLEPFYDYTNDDPKYLRSRMRTELIPSLSQSFGKTVDTALCHLGVEAAELKDYLDERTRPYLQQIVTGKMGTCIDLSHNCPESPFELKHLIRLFLAAASLCGSRDNINNMCNLIKSSSADRMMVIGGKNIYVDRRRVFILSCHKHQLFDTALLKKQLVPMPLKMGNYSYGPWQLRVENAHNVETFIETLDIKTPATDWLDVWKGSARTFISSESSIENCILAMHSFNDISKDTKLSLDKWWTKHKVPAFMRTLVPIIFENDGKKFHEFLSGKFKIHDYDKKFLISITLC